MIHPLSSINEIEYYLEVASSKYVLTANLFANKVIKASRKANVEKVIVADVVGGKKASIPAIRIVVKAKDKKSIREMMIDD